MALIVSTYFGTVCAQQSAAVTQKVDGEHVKLAVNERQQKLQADADHLVAMAQQLKLAVEKAKRDELSMEVIRQADGIDKLVRALKEHVHP